MSLDDKLKTFDGKLTKIKENIEKRIGPIIGAVFFAVIAYIVARPVLEWSHSTLALIGHLAILSVYFVILAGWAWMISGIRGESLFRDLRSRSILKYNFLGGIEGPIAGSIGLLLFASVCFASLSSTLSDLEWLHFEPALPKGNLGPIVDLYTWHFLKAIPLNIPDILVWAEPFKRKDWLSGLPLLIFNIAVIIPVIGSFSAWNKIRKEMQLGQQYT